MASFELNCILKIKRDAQQVSEKFIKREFVVTTDLNTQYPQFISLQLSQDKCALLDAFNVGDEMKVSFNLRGREWNGPDGIKYFNSLEAWRLERIGTQTSAPAMTPQAAPAQSADIMSSQEIADDLPF